MRGSRRALITGAASGLAAGIAPALVRDGFARIAITYRATPPDATLAAIEAAGADGVAQRIDFLDDAAAVARALDEIVRNFGPFDTLIHSVGPLVAKHFADAALEDYRVAFDGNVRSAVLAARATLPGMRASGFGRIVFFAAHGAANNRPFRRLSLYQAAKSALIVFARTLAIEEGPNGITVNAVAPGDISDKRIDRAEARRREAVNPSGRPGSFEDVSDAVRFLVAEERDFITGTVIEVTGGLQTSAERKVQDKQRFGA
ncbi:MAG: SDR family oxidoreductase [Candidatus Eremiobacteraeota bacterium]|nr:SDR family oxidoreductase [Candidatus Eremiobacteraeota bacterium]